MTAASPACATCGGEWICSLSFDHADTCPLGKADAHTVAEDRERLIEDVRDFTRPTTRVEGELAAALGRPPRDARITQSSLGSPDRPDSYTLVQWHIGGEVRRWLRYRDTGASWDANAGHDRR